MSRRIVNVACPVCHRLTRDSVREDAGRVAFHHREHAAGQSAAQLERYRRRSAGRSARLPAITSLVLDFADLPRASDVHACHCDRCGRLEVSTAELLAAFARYRDTGRRQTIPATRPASK